MSLCWKRTFLSARLEVPSDSRLLHRLPGKAQLPEANQNEVVVVVARRHLAAWRQQELASRMLSRVCAKLSTFLCQLPLCMLLEDRMVPS